MKGGRLLVYLIYYVLFSYGGQRQPFFSDVKQLAFMFRGVFGNGRKNCCAQPALADDLHGIASGLGTACIMNRVWLSSLCRTDHQWSKAKGANSMIQKGPVHMETGQYPLSKKNILRT